MWKNNKKDNNKCIDNNYKNEPIQLLLPIIEKQQQQQQQQHQRHNNQLKANNIDPTATKTKTNNNNSAMISYIGGEGYYYTHDSTVTKLFHESKEKDVLKCNTCNNDLYLISQLYAPIDKYLHRTLYVYGCNTLSCCNSWDGVSSFDLINNSFICIRSQIPMHANNDNDNDNANDNTNKVSNHPQDHANTNKVTNDGNSNVTSDDDDDDDFDWDCNDDDDDDDDNKLSLQELEAMINNNNNLTNKQTTTNNINATTTTRSNNKIIKEETTKIESSIIKTNNNFNKYNVEWHNEPKTDATNFNNKTDPTGTSTDDDDYDSDDNNNNDASIDDIKIELMLQKYLDIEDDEYIIQSINNNNNKKKVTATSSSSNNNHDNDNNDEAYERLLPKQQVFYTFTNRIKRAPSQILRYAYGGMPMWSIPCVDIMSNDHIYNTNTSNKNMKHKNKTKTTSAKIPNCKCGAKREFEFQIMPSILHTLNVDNYNNTHTNENKETILSSLGCKNNDNATTTTNNNNASSSLGGAMNWGVIAIYSCSLSCELSREEFVVVQSAV